MTQKKVELHIPEPDGESVMTLHITKSTESFTQGKNMHTRGMFSLQMTLPDLLKETCNKACDTESE